MRSVVLLLCALAVCSGDQWETRLRSDLLSNYDSMSRPVLDKDDAVNVTLGVTLLKITDVNEWDETMSVRAWLSYTWKDAYLVWDPEEYGGVEALRVQENVIYEPDVELYNTAAAPDFPMFPFERVLYSNGEVTKIAPGIFTFSCDLDPTYFPFDEQRCFLKFGSWTFNGNDMNLTKTDVNLDTYKESGEWTLVGTEAVRNLVFYSCCPEPYGDVTFHIHIARNGDYFFWTLVFPCILISILTVAGFGLSPLTSERIILDAALFLGVVLVTFQMVGTTARMCLLFEYFICIMVAVVLSVLLTIVVRLFQDNAKVKKVANVAGMILVTGFLLLVHLVFLIRFLAQ